jgi:hypothetical protein
MVGLEGVEVAKGSRRQVFAWFVDAVSPLPCKAMLDAKGSSDGDSALLCCAMNAKLLD